MLRKIAGPDGDRGGDPGGLCGSLRREFSPLVSVLASVFYERDDQD